MTTNFDSAIEYEVFPNGLVIYDFHRNYLTSHEVNDVLASIKNDLPDLTTRKIFYRNFMGRFDEIVISAAGEFITLRPLNALTPKKALAISHPSSFH